VSGKQAEAPIIVTVRLVGPFAPFDDFQEDLITETQSCPRDELSGLEALDNEILGESPRGNGKTFPTFSVGDVLSPQKTQGPAGMIAMRIALKAAANPDNGLIKGDFRLLTFSTGTNSNQSAHKISSRFFLFGIKHDNPLSRAQIDNNSKGPLRSNGVGHEIMRETPPRPPPSCRTVHFNGSRLLNHGTEGTLSLSPVPGAEEPAHGIKFPLKMSSVIALEPAETVSRPLSPNHKGTAGSGRRSFTGKTAALEQFHV
jgi:hypothetical protein